MSPLRLVQTREKERSKNLKSTMYQRTGAFMRFSISGAVRGEHSVVRPTPESLDDPESRLAQGEKLILDCAGIIELELLNGVSDTTAAHIIAAKPLLQRSRQPPQFALQAVHGLGTKKAQDLARFIDISTRCTTAPHVLTPFSPPQDPPARREVVAVSTSPFPAHPP